MSTAHPPADRLAAYALLLLGAEEATRVAEHVQECRACRSFLESLSESGLAALSQTRVVVPPARGQESEAESPAKLPSTLPQGPGSPSCGGDTSFQLALSGEVPAELAAHPRYEVRRLLGSGGMGVVYEARHRLMDRRVALKVIHPMLVDRPDMEGRFTREVKAAARLSHPNIVAAYDAEHSGDLHFLVMEFVEGTDLEQMAAAKGQLPLAVACEYARQTALGLQHAYERGMVHRDIKPHNLMLTPEGQVKILDFGLARFVSEALPVALEATGGYLYPPPAPASGGRTNPPAVVYGTADYLAPEEARDPHSADIRADIYSLGCTLYRFLAGRVPFVGGNWAEKVQAARSQTPTPLSDLRPDLPAELCRVVERMLAKDPAERPATPAEVTQALAPFALAPSASVLVVDDNPAIRRSMRKVLERRGYAVTTAENGREALECLHAGLRPGMILLDLLMPVMDGWEFLRRLRQDPELVSIPTILITALDESQAEELARGAVGYLQKPIDVQKLTERLQQHTPRG